MSLSLCVSIALALLTPWAFYLLILGLAALRPPPARRSGRRPRLAVLVPAHDEGPHIAATVKAIRRRLDAEGGGRLVVVADNCSDDTGARARAAGAEVWERQDPQRRGKGHALRFAQSWLMGEADWDALIVLDADARPEPGFFDAMSGAFAAGAAAAQAHYRTAEDRGPWRAGVQRLA